jgi:predicted AAA+ superfamily ATPase
MYVEREIGVKFPRLCRAYGAVALVGARQAGKTTFLKHAAEGNKAAYVTFDDPDARELFESDVKRFERQYLEGAQYAILDEVHYCRNAGRDLKYLVDNGRKLRLTSSSEMLLSKEILSYLVGRISIIRLYPFSLGEFLSAKGVQEATDKALARSVAEHISYGGYPKAVLEADSDMKKTILADLYQTMLLKDVAQTFSISDMGSLESFCRYLAANAGGILSYENACTAAGISFQTVKKYLHAMEKSHVVMLSQPFFANKQKEIVKRPKAYFVDCGLRNAVARNFPAAPSGQMFENYVFTELMKAGHAPKYWRTKAGAEVDFVIEEGGRPIPVEAKLEPSEGKVESGLRAFIDSFKPPMAVVVGLKAERRMVKAGGCKVFFTDVAGLRGAIGAKA